LRKVFLRANKQCNNERSKLLVVHGAFKNAPHVGLRTAKPLYIGLGFTLIRRRAGLVRWGDGIGSGEHGKRTICGNRVETRLYVGGLWRVLWKLSPFMFSAHFASLRFALPFTRTNAPQSVGCAHQRASYQQPIYLPNSSIGCRVKNSHITWVASISIDV
jgi:hypothetical protein